MIEIVLRVNHEEDDWETGNLIQAIEQSEADAYVYTIREIEDEED